MLDNTAMVLRFEGGHGFDPESGKSNLSHSTENMVALVAGGAGALRRGVHLVARDVHPARVVATCLQGVGLEDRLGEVSGRVPGVIG